MMGCGASQLPADIVNERTQQFTSDKRPRQNGVQLKRRSLQPRNSFYFTEQLYFDEAFIPEIQINHEGYFDQIEWKRPYMLTNQPEMFVSGSEPGDINQGLLGDCWFLSACAAVSISDKFMEQIIPTGQCLIGLGYTGKLTFHFWQYGEWLKVVTDDLLPTVKQKLIFAHSADENEFWVPLIEKAYAKLNGSYDALEGGRAMDAFVDLTGGFSERFDLTEPNLNVYNKLSMVRKSGGVIACSRKGNWQPGKQTVDEFGLVSGHAYTVSDIHIVQHQYGKEQLIKVRNPWGDGAEWKGAWSDGDSCWSWVSEDTRNELNVIEEADGEFWMAYSDFCHHFSEVTTCLPPDPHHDVTLLHGGWVRSRSAGGCRNDMDSFITNPQYLLHLSEACHIHIALMQKPSDRRQLLQIGFIVYESSQRLSYEELCRKVEIGKSGVYINHREVNGRFDLNGGKYILIPSTFKPGDESEYIIRITPDRGKISVHLCDTN